MMDKIRTRLLRLPRRQKRILQVIADVLLVWVALWMSFVVRLGFDELNNPFVVFLAISQCSDHRHSAVHPLWHVPCRHALFW